MKKFSILISSIALSMLPYMGFTQARLVEKVEKKGNEVVIPYTRYEYPNGLTLVVHEDHSDPIVHVDVTYHVGSAREEIQKSGFAHFFEHMMFQGSDNVADEQHFKIITEAGGTLNGTTNRDRTNYFQTVPKNQLEKMLWLEADRMGFLLDAVTQQKFEIQRATVKNERAQRYDNQPYGLVFENSSKYLYPYGHPYSWLTIGYIEDLDRVTVDDLKNFFLRWYGPNNAVITIGGDVNKEEVVKLVDKYFGSIPRGAAVENMPAQVPTLTADRYVTMTDQYAKFPMLRVVYPAPPSYTKDEAALDCLAEIIGQGNNSMMYQTLVKSRKALQASAYNMSSELAGEFTLSIIPTKGNSIKDMDQAVKDIFAAFEKRGVTQADVDKFIAQIESSTIYGLESVSGKVSQLAAFHTFTGSPNFIGKYLEMYKSITPQDVMNAYNKYIKGKGSVRLSVTTKEDPSDIAGDSKYVIDTTKYVKPDYGYEGLVYNKAKDNFDRSIMPAAGKDLSVVSPNFWQENKANISYIGTNIDEIPVVNLFISLPGGRMVEGEEKAGLASLFAAMMNEDTRVRTSEDFSKELDLLGSSISVSSGLDNTTVMVRTLTKNLDKTMALLEERMLQPKFNQDDFDRIKNQVIEGYKNNLTRPANVASNVLSKLMYGNSALGRGNGNDKTIENITLKDIEDYYARHFNIKNGEVVVVGSIDKNTIMKKLNFLSKFPQNRMGPKPVQLPRFQYESMSNGKQIIYFIDFPGAAQTEFRIAQHTDMKYDGNGDFFKSGIMNYPLGGVFNSRLNLYLREEKGWTYGARSGFSGNKYVGSFSFSGGILANATDSALKDVLEIIETYKVKGASQEELDFTKSAKLQSEARQYETGSQKAYYLSDIQRYRLPKDIAAQQTKILKNISLNEINQLAKSKIADTNQFLILLVGDKNNLSAETLQKYEIRYLDKEGNPIK